MTILAIDPGTHESAIVLWDGERVRKAEMLANKDLLASFYFPICADIVAIEMIQCFGMPVGHETFETVLFIGRLLERCSLECRLIYRKDVKMHHCRTMKAKDANIRQALLDRFGGKNVAIGNKTNPGPFHGVTGHCWSALAIATFVFDTQAERMAA